MMLAPLAVAALATLLTHANDDAPPLPPSAEAREAPPATPPPPPPAPPTSSPPAASATPPGENAAGESPTRETPPDDASPASPAAKQDAEVDSFGDPIMPYADSTPDASRDVQFADETPSPAAELEYASETPEPGLEVTTQERPSRPGPSAEAVARESTVPPPGRKRRFQRWAGAPGESKQRFFFDLRFGPYVPAVDAKWSGEGLGPYATIYGEQDSNGVAIDQPRPGVFSGANFEWQFIYLGGPLSIGTSLGFFRDKSKALLADPPTDGNVRSEADETSFSVIPVTLMLGYRLEVLADRFKVPLVPFARAGLGYGFWWSRRGDGKLSTNDAGVKGRGGSLGWQVELGGMLRLDFIEYAAARELDRLTGINHTYLFGLYQFSRLDGFGGDRRMSVGADTWLVGLAIEF